MTIIKLKERYLPLAIILIAVFSVIGYIQEITGLQINNTAVWWLLQIGILYLFFISKKYFFNNNESKIVFPISLYIGWNIICICRGLFIVETYWDWKGLITNSLSLLLPIVAYLATNTEVVQKILKFYIRYGLPLFICLVPIITAEGYGIYLVPLSFLVLFHPVIKKRWKWIIIGLSFVAILADLGARSNVIKFGIPIILGFSYYFRSIFSLFFFNVIHKILFFTPFILFGLAINGVFNVFNMDEYIEGNYIEIKRDDKGHIIEDKLTADTRTFLYVEVLKTAQVYDSWLIGRSPARGNISDWFGENDLNNRGERLGNEVAILNIFTWSGMVGVVLYLVIFYKASFLAINKSNNFFSKILGLFIAFRWLYSWVEDINEFRITTCFLWIMIGMCFSTSFRSMSNKEFIIWVRGIFEKKKQLPRRMKFNPNFNPNI